MKPKTTLLLAGVLVVLGAIAVLVQTNRNRTFSAEGKPIFREFNAGKVDGIDITSPEESVQLRKQGDTWRVASEGGHEAELRYPKEIVEAMDLFSTSTLISSSREKHASFEVDSTAIRVKLLQGGRDVADFLVGKPGPDFMSTYVRPTGGDNVYLIPVYLRTSVDRGGESWRKTTLLDVPVDQIVSYTTRTTRETVSLEKDEQGVWQITEPVQAPARGDIVSIVLRSLGQVRATGYGDSTLTTAAAGLEADTTGVTFKTADGSTHKFRIGASNPSSQSYTMLDDDPTIYLIQRGRWNTVLRPLATLQATEGPPGGVTAPPMGAGGGSATPH